MNWDIIEGNWRQYKGKFQEKWGELTDDEFDMIAGKRDQLIGKLQEKYGFSRDRAEREADEFGRTLH
ncbi:MAG: CsbD family protein [Desulfobacteraceae bacterium]|nr:MAG: CsbD family protein [Desulfobacteraceae bacterium]